MYAFLNLEVVVRWQEGDRFVDLLIVEDIIGYRIEGTSCTSRLGNLKLLAM